MKALVAMVKNCRIIKNYWRLRLLRSRQPIANGYSSIITTAPGWLIVYPVFIKGGSVRLEAHPWFQNQGGWENGGRQ
jgi:hypothetical protein